MLLPIGTKWILNNYLEGIVINGRLNSKYGKFHCESFKACRTFLIKMNDYFNFALETVVYTVLRIFFDLSVKDFLNEIDLSDQGRRWQTV